MQPSVLPFGTLNTGEPVFQITLNNGTLACRILTYGATLRTLCVPDRHGRPVDVVLGYDTLEEYVSQDGYLGATVGRFANRIAKGRFTLHGTEYTLACNDGNNHLHGGNQGFSHKVWAIQAAQNNAVTLTLHSPDGEEGYPGNLSVSVTYTLKENGLFLDYHAVSDADTICSLTNHSYFNLGGHDSGSVLAQHIAIFADHYTPSDSESIPTGALESVDGTPMDLRTPTRIGAHIDEPFQQLLQGHGYDHNFALRAADEPLPTAAKAFCEETGISMRVCTSLPGLQFYTANYLNQDRPGKSGSHYGPRQGFCLETQLFPDTPNQPAFPSALLKAQQHYHSTTGFLFELGESMI